MAQALGRDFRSVRHWCGLREDRATFCAEGELGKPGAPTAGGLLRPHPGDSAPGRPAGLLATSVAGTTALFQAVSHYTLFR